MSGDAGNWTQDISHAKRALYPWATSPSDVEDFLSIYLTGFNHLVRVKETNKILRHNYSDYDTEKGSFSKQKRSQIIKTFYLCPTFTCVVYSLIFVIFHACLKFFVIVYQETDSFTIIQFMLLYCWQSHWKNARNSPKCKKF